MKPLVSICIPSLGRESSLNRLLDLLPSTVEYEPYEVVVRYDDWPPNNRGCPNVLHECYEAARGDFICFLGNDVIPQPGFLRIAMEAMNRWFPDMDGMGSFFDGYWMGELGTHFVISRKLIEKLGDEIFHRGYYHCYSDSELTARAIQMNKYVFCEEAQIIHDHPAGTGKVVRDGDPVYSIGYARDRVEHDRNLLVERAAKLGFPVIENICYPRIPRKAFTFWLGDTPIPELVKKCMASQREFTKGWEYRVLTLDDIPRNIPYVEQAIAAKKWVKAVDYLRIYYLYQEGGVYFDADVELLKPIPDPMRTDRMFAGVERNRWIGNGVVGAEAGHPVLAKILETVEAKFRGDDDRNFEAANQVLTETVYDMGLEKYEVRLYEPEVFTPYDHQGKTVNVTDKTVAYHHYMVSWGYPAVHPLIDLRPRLGDLAGKKVLNIGIGRGDSGLGRQLPALHFERIDHVEVHEPYIEAARQQFWVAKQVNFHCADVRQFPVEDYDLVLAFDVLEHLPKQDSLDLLARCPHILVYGPLEHELQNQREGVDDIPSQDHLSLWTEQDFIDLGFETQRLPGFHQERGLEWDSLWASRGVGTERTERKNVNPLKQWFDAHTTGPGVWKWEHYWDVYDHFFAKFRGRPVNICEVGIYSGGSLQMWRDYFGPLCQVYGVDIQPACRKFENDWCRVFIGDQEDREFWKYFKSQVPQLDILIDDGGHAPGQQLVTLEEMLPHLSPGGVYVCEDILGEDNPFAAYIGKMGCDLHPNVDIHATDMLAMGLTAYQRMVNSVHVYPHIAVIEKWLEAPARFEGPGAGSEWIHLTPEWKL